MDYYYLGLRNNGCWESFASDETEVTPESTGYNEVSGPYDSEEEAEADI